MYDLLKEREEKGQPVNVGSNGAGWMGQGFVSSMRHVPGMRIAVLSDSDIDTARKALVDLGGLADGDIVETRSDKEAEKAVAVGKTVITDDSTLAGRLPSVDVVTDVTPSPATGAHVALAAIEAGKDVVLINIETDVAVGSILKKKAAEKGVLYSVSSGDEPGCLMELWDFVRCLGYTPVVIGKGKNNPLNVDAFPEDVAESAKRDNKDPYQVCSYVDGTKTMFELGCVANATGCRPFRPGMIGPVADLNNVSNIFALKEDGGLSEFTGGVDYVAGSAMSGGVFVTVKVEDDRIVDDLRYLKVGKGPYFTFFRPYHLWFLEAPISIAKAVIKRETTLLSLDKPVCDVVAVAKKNLTNGDTMDVFGGYTFRGLMKEKGEAFSENALPAALAPDAAIIRNVKKGTVITWDDVELNENSALVRLRREQDASY